MRWICSLICWLIAAESMAAQSYTFTTIAGVPGQAGGEDGTNTGARFSGPAGLVLDSQGNLYVTEDGNHTVRKLSPVGNDWIVTTIAGQSGQSGNSDGTNSQARFYRPRGLAVSSSGTLFIADSYNSTIRRIDPVGTDWVVTTVAGSAGVLEHEDGYSTNAIFHRPSSVAVSIAGTLFVADMNNHVIRQIEYTDPDWYVSTIAGFPFLAGSVDGTGSAAEFAAPYSLVCVKGGTLFVADTGNNAVREMQFAADGWAVVTIAGTLGAPAGTNDGIGPDALFNFPAGIAANNSGSLFVSDQQNHTLRLLTQDSGTWTVATIGGSPMASGTNDGVGSAARFQRPWGIAADDFGTVYVADTRNHTIRKGVPSGTPARPQLSLQAGPEGIVISWPLGAADYVLENSSSLAPQALWTETSAEVVAGPDSFLVTVSTAGSTAFFRLRKR